MLDAVSKTALVETLAAGPRPVVVGQALSALHPVRSVLVTVRPGVGRGDVVLRMVEASGGTVLRLGPLGPDDTVALVARANPELVDPERRRVAAVSAGGELGAELEAARNLIGVQIGLGRHAEARALLERSIERARAEGAERWVIELRTLDVLSRFYDGGDQDDAIDWLSWVRTSPARLETRATATSTLAAALADRGFADRSAAVLTDWVDPERVPGYEPMVAAILLWGAAQRAWIIGDLSDTIRLGRWATELLGHGFPTLAGTQVVWRWAEYERGLPLTAPSPAGALLDAAEREAEGIGLLADGDHTAAAEVLLGAARAWQPILWRCTLRARWGAGHALALAGDPAAETVLRAVDDELDRSHCPARVEAAAALGLTIR